MFPWLLGRGAAAAAGKASSLSPPNSVNLCCGKDSKPSYIQITHGSRRKVSYSQGTAESPGRPHCPGAMPHAYLRLKSKLSSVHLPPTCYDEDKCQVTSHSVLLLGETSSLRGRCKGNPEAEDGQILKKPSGNNSNVLQLGN